MHEARVRLAFTLTAALICAGLIGLGLVLASGTAPGAGSRPSAVPGLQQAIRSGEPSPHIRWLSFRGPSGPATLRLFETPTPASQPTKLVADGHGGFWFTEQGSDRLGHVSQTGRFREYRVLTLHSQPFALALDGRGNVWFTELAAGKLGRVDPAGHVVEFSLADRSAQPYALARGSDGKMWFTEYGADIVGNVDFQGRLTEYRLPTKDASPAGIALGADGNMWVTESGYSANKLARVTPAGAITEYRLPSQGAQPFGIAASGRTLWMTEFGAGKIASANLSGHIAEYDVPTAPATPLALTVATDGHVWFTAPATDELGELTVRRGHTGIVVYPLPKFAVALDIAPGQHETLWTTDYLLDSVGIFTPLVTGQRHTLRFAPPQLSLSFVA